jgi:hypothetical protein
MVYVFISASQWLVIYLVNFSLAAVLPTLKGKKLKQPTKRGQFEGCYFDYHKDDEKVQLIF